MKIQDEILQAIEDIQKKMFLKRDLEVKDMEMLLLAALLEEAGS